MKYSSVHLFLSSAICLVIGIVVSSIYYDAEIINQNNMIASLKNQSMLENNSTQSKALLTHDELINTSKDDLAEDNNDLKNEIKRLALILAARDNQINDILADNVLKASSEQNSIAKKVSQSPEYLKSTLLPQTIPPVINDLTKELNLTTKESEKISQLLAAKAEADIDVSAAYVEMLGDNDDKKSNNEEMNELLVNVESKLAQNQLDYQNKIASLLTNEQLDNYRNYELKKYQQHQNMANNYAVSEISEIVGNLNEYQIDELKLIFQTNPSVDSSNISLGVSGSPYARQQNNNSAQQSSIQQRLEGLLTHEQLQAYSEYQNNLIRKQP